jgi:hypothetical protein
MRAAVGARRFALHCVDEVRHHTVWGDMPRLRPRKHTLTMWSVDPHHQRLAICRLTVERSRPKRHAIPRTPTL